MIGGIGEIIEIKEIKFGRQKFNVGRIREGKWILGIIE